MNLEITLNDAEQTLAKTAARLRYENNRARGIANRRAGGQSDQLTDLEGVGGEIAFCRITGIQSPTLDDLVRDVPIAAPDAVLGGVSVDVKTTKYKTGRLIVSRSSSSHDVVDAYALVTGRFPTYSLRGYALKSDIITESRIDYTLPTPAYAMDQSDLVSFPWVQGQLA